MLGPERAVFMKVYVINTRLQSLCMGEKRNIVGPPFNIPQCKVFPHLKFSFEDPKSIISMLNALHLRIPSI
jgi:hypothetical protein